MDTTTSQVEATDSIEISNDNAKNEPKVSVKIRSIRNVPGVENRNADQAAAKALELYLDLVKKLAHPAA